MLTALLKFPLRWSWAHPAARFAVGAAVYAAAVGLIARTTGNLPLLLRLLLWAGAVSVGIYYLIRLVSFVRDRVLWRLRRRLIVTYVFIAVVPVLLILVLVGIGVFLINGQFAAFLVGLKLRGRFDELRQLSRVVAHEAHQSPGPSPQRLLDRLEKFYLSELSEHAASYPGLEVSLRVGGLERSFRLDGQAPAHRLTVPAWLKEEEFAGVVIEGNLIALRAVNRGPTGVGELTIILSQPLTPELLDLVGEGIGPVGVIVPQRDPARPLSPGAPFRTRQGEGLRTEAVHSKSLEPPSPANRLDFTVLGGSILSPIVWGGEKQEHSVLPVVLYARSRVVRLNRQLFAPLGEFSGAYLTVFVMVAAMFLVIELVALVIGVRLTRSMTTTVDRLYDATRRVQAGDLAHRINLPGRDQLSALGEAFDAMTASVERLLLESKEKSRLESEIEIAREVQRQLFPRVIPRPHGVELYGVCKPASGVSGDYYDFFKLDGDRVGLVLSDVSGKGISAALLMATIRAALHAQGSSAALSTAHVVAQLNCHLFESSPAEKYATLFYAVYHPESRRLTYTNAGHWPPIVFRRDAVQRLEAGGTAVGLFPSVTYQQSEIQLEPDDLLLAFTDGITEPENSFGEEFGEDRVIEVIRRAAGAQPELLVEELYRSVLDWTGSGEIQDDMTVIVAKMLG